jgi:hypothetical protein
MREIPSKTMNRINNAICLLFATAAFAMIGLEAAGHHASNHSGTQSFSRISK